MPQTPVPDAPARIADVRAALQERSVQRMKRLQVTTALSPTAFQRLLNALRARIDDHLARTPGDRPTPFPTLDDTELGILERQLEWYRSEGRLGSLRGSAAIDTPLQVLRVNRVARAELVSGAGFRAAALRIARETRNWTLEFLRAQAVDRRRPPAPNDLILVIPWPSGFLAAEDWSASGYRMFWHCSCTRDPEALTPHVATRRNPPQSTRMLLHLVTLPVLATGRTAAALIEELLGDGVPECRIAVETIIAAPEGIDAVLSTFRKVRLVACAVDDHVDTYGNVAGSGIGDFAALALRGVDRTYANDHWIDRGILSPDDAEWALGAPERDALPRTPSDRAAHDAPTHPSIRIAPDSRPPTPPDRAATIAPQFPGEDDESWAAEIPDDAAPIAHA